MKEIETLKLFALIEELETANNLIKLGFGELQNINLENDFYFLPFQLLSQGFERFMKAYICLGYLEKNDVLPNIKYLKKMGHDLEKLLSEIKNNYYIKYKPVQFEKDFKLLEDDLFKELLFILSEFGKLARYHNFDLITGVTKPSVNPKELWEELENKMMPIDEVVEKLPNPDTCREVYYQITQKIIIILEKFVAGFSRQMMFGTLGERGKQLVTSNFFDFGLLYDDDFGKKDYRKNTTRFKENLKPSHKRTFKDKINRKFNSNYKSKKITKGEYDGEWPFCADEVVVEKRNRSYCVVSINGKDYALNGLASSFYKLETAHEAGVAFPQIGMSEFIKMTLELD